MEPHGMKSRKAFKKLASTPCQYMLLWIGENFGSEGWGFKSLRARQPIHLAEDSTVCSAPSFNLSRVGDCRSI